MPRVSAAGAATLPTTPARVKAHNDSGTLKIHSSSETAVIEAPPAIRTVAGDLRQLRLGAGRRVGGRLVTGEQVSFEAAREPVDAHEREGCPCGREHPSGRQGPGAEAAVVAVVGPGQGEDVVREGPQREPGSQGQGEASLGRRSVCGCSGHGAVSPGRGRVVSAHLRRIIRLVGASSSAEGKAQPEGRPVLVLTVLTVSSPPLDVAGLTSPGCGVVVEGSGGGR